MAFPLSAATPSSLGLDPRALDRLQELITRHLAEGRYPGAQIAVARDGKLALFRSFGVVGLAMASGILNMPGTNCWKPTWAPPPSARA